jgi:hypothetical protein
MHYLLIILSVLTISCKKENSLGNSASLLKADAKSALILQNEDNSFLARKKIMNQLVEEKIPSLTNNLANRINPHDELVGFQMLQKELDTYVEKEKNMAKLVVSYQDHMEIYFLPNGFPLNQVFGTLRLQVDPERSFKWLKHDSSSAYPGGTFYLVSVNLDDIVKNDQNFFQEVTKQDKKLQDYLVKLPAGKALDVTINYNAFKQKEKIETVLWSYQYCNYQNSVSCGQCSYKISAASDQFEKMAPPSLAELNLVVRVDEHDVGMDELHAKVMNGNVLRFKVDADLVNDSQIVLGIDKQFEDAEKRVNGFDYTPQCESQRVEESFITLRKKFEATSEIVILGRGTEVLKKVL